MTHIGAETRVTAARYDAQGYALVQWVTEGLERPATSFLVSMRGVRPGETMKENFVVEDGMSRSGSFACELSAGLSYMVCVTPARGDEMLPGSPWFPLELGPQRLSHFAFVERLPYTPLLLDMAYNVVKVQLRLPDGTPMARVPIRWSVPPAYPSVRLESKQATYTDANGIAANRILVSDARDLPGLLTVSAWSDEPSANAAAHMSALFACVRPRVFSSFVRNYAHPIHDEGNLASGAGALTDDELITSTTTILDDKNRPIRGLRFAWRMEPNAATYAFSRASPDGPLEPLQWTTKPIYELGYAGYTNDQGQATISFANTASTIMTFSPAVNSIEYQNDVVFTDVETRGTMAPLSLPLNRNTLELNAYPESVPVTVPFGPISAGRVAIWLNQDIASIVYRTHAAQISGPMTIEIPSWRFPSNVTNAAGYVQGDLYGNAEDSRLVRFQVEGHAQLPKPVDVPSSAPRAPELVRPGVTVIDNSTIANGLLIRVPVYPKMTAGQRVSLNLFISGYYQGTNALKYDYPTLRHDVETDDLSGGFVLVVDEELLTGFSQSREGRPGSFIAQYSIATPGAIGSPSPVYSRQFVVAISTTVPYRPSDWVALDFGES